MSRKAHPKSPLHLLSQPPADRGLTGSADAVADVPRPPYACCSECGSLVAVFIFFVAIEPLLNLHGEPRLFQGYDVTEVRWDATHLRGAI